MNVINPILHLRKLRAREIQRRGKVRFMETTELGPAFRSSDAVSRAGLVLPQEYLSMPRMRRPLRSSSTTHTDKNLPIRKPRACQLP